METVYELGYLLKNDLENKGLLSELSKVSAEIVHSVDPKAQKLAYKIEKQDSAQFGYLHFKIQEPEKLSQLDKALNSLDELLRFIIVKLPSKKDTGKKRAEKKAPVKSSDEFKALSNEKLEEKLEEFVS